MISATSQCREVKVLWVLLTGVICLFTPTVSHGAQDEQACAPEKNFAKVGYLLEKKDYQGAKVLLRRLEACPHLSPVQRFNVGWLYGKAHDFPDALKIFKSVQPNVPDRLTHAYAIALVHFDQGHYQAAIDTLTALRSKKISDAKCADLLSDAYYNLITLFVDTGELDKAAQVADKAVAALPQNAEALSMRGSIELSQGKTEDAYRDFASAAQLSPGSPDPPFFMGLAEYRQSKFEEAGQVLKNAIASGIVDSDLHYLLAECLIRIDGTDSATVLAELDRAIQLNPNSVSARVLRGERLLAAGRPQDALIDLKIARELEPNPQRDARNATYLLARAYVAVGKREQAKVLFAQLSRQFSSDKADSLNRLSDHKMQAALHR